MKISRLAFCAVIIALVLYASVVNVSVQCPVVSRMAMPKGSEILKVKPAQVCKFLSFSTIVYAQETGINQEEAFLKKMPQDILERIAEKGRPDVRGMLDRNRQGWLHPRFQMPAALYLIVAASQGSESRANDAWRAIDAVFERQTEAGNFQLGSFNGKKPGRMDDLSGVSFWLNSLCHAILVVQQSDMAAAFDERIKVLMPKIKKTAYWLADGCDELKSYDVQAANRLFHDANAFGFSGLLLNDENLKSIGRDFLEAGLKLQREDGVFMEKGGHDSGYQAVSLMLLQSYAIYFPEERLNQAIERGIKWELSRVKDNGEIEVAGNTRTGLGQEEFFGKIKDVSYESAVLAFLYYAGRTGSQDTTATAERIYKYVTLKR
ncbi:MAG: hypothetical protein WCI77_02360 [Candidatus Omnitrophota bacterium]